MFNYFNYLLGSDLLDEVLEEHEGNEATSELGREVKKYNV